MKNIILIKSSFDSMMANKTRTALTVLGVVIGIASVIIVYSAGHGIERLILGQVESFGTDIIEVEVKIPTNNKTTSNASTAGAADLVQGAQITTLTLDDMEDIIDLPNVDNAYAGIMGQELVSYSNEQKKGFIFGTNASYIDIDQSEIEFGRFFSEEENRTLSKVVVLGFNMKEKLFGESDALGKQIRIRKTKFRVIGVMKERGGVMGMNFDDYVYVPVKTLQKRIMGIDHILYLIANLKDLSIAEETAREARLILRENHDISVDDENEFNKDDFRVVTMAEMMSILDTITGAITLLLLAIVAISLVVGGVGIMNIMYVIVSERSQEIGLRKSVGAKYLDIMKQFLFESTIITIFGGIIGVAVGVLVSFLVSIGANSAGLDWEFAVPLEGFVVALGFSTFFGIVFGIYPARKAAKLDPIMALRQD